MCTRINIDWKAGAAVNGNGTMHARADVHVRQG